MGRATLSSQNAEPCGGACPQSSAGAQTSLCPALCPAPPPPRTPTSAAAGADGHEPAGHAGPRAHAAGPPGSQGRVWPARPCLPHADLPGPSRPGRGLLRARLCARPLGCRVLARSLRVVRGKRLGQAWRVGLGAMGGLFAPPVHGRAPPLALTSCSIECAQRQARRRPPDSHAGQLLQGPSVRSRQPRSREVPRAPTCAHTHIHSHTHVHTHKHARAYARTHIHTCARTHIHTKIHTRAHAHTHIHALAQACACAALLTHWPTFTQLPRPPRNGLTDTCTQAMYLSPLLH